MAAIALPRVILDFPNPKDEFHRPEMKWRGDYLYLIENLVLKDFRVRYRNMSLGVLWSLLNPLVMMGVLTFVFTSIFPNRTIAHFPLFVLCGMVPYNFFTIAWLTGTTSIVDNNHLIKRVPVPREIVPITTVAACCIHLVVQIGLLLVIAMFSGKGFNVNWLWLPVVWLLEIIFVCGLALVSASINVFIRDTRYMVESMNLVLFWLVPVFYSSDIIPAKYLPIVDLNPISALVISLRKILINAEPPAAATLAKLMAVSCTVFIVGLFVFRRMKPRFYEHI
jgi:homopolymeric O-antigen transport system permease protein